MTDPAFISVYTAMWTGICIGMGLGWGAGVGMQAPRSWAIIGMLVFIAAAFGVRYLIENVTT